MSETEPSMADPIRYVLGDPDPAAFVAKDFRAGRYIMSAPEPDPGHVWVVYSHDNGPYAISIHTAAEEAAREAARTGYAHAAKWPLGMELADAIKEWEGR